MERIAHDTFADLLIRNDFTEASAERSVISTDLYFTRVDRGFQITLEYREMRVDIYLLQLVDGKVPENGYILGGEVV